MRRVAGVPRTTRTASFTIVFYLIIIVSRARDFVNNGDAHRREANANARNGKSPSFDELFRRGVEVRITEDLWPLAESLKYSTLDSAFCRMENANPKKGDPRVEYFL